jgi:hypothetical protein
MTPDGDDLVGFILVAALCAIIAAAVLFAFAP